VRFGISDQGPEKVQNRHFSGYQNRHIFDDFGTFRVPPETALFGSPGPENGRPEALYGYPYRVPQVPRRPQIVKMTKNADFSDESALFVTFGIADPRTPLPPSKSGPQTPGP